MKKNRLIYEIFVTCCFLLFGHMVIAQQITRKVTDENGGPLPGVNILVKGTMQGAVSDIDGDYKINVNDENATLVFSFIGYNTEEIPIATKTVIDVVMIPEISKLDEVVVIGYGTMRKRDLTGSVASVNSDQLKNIPITSTAQAITGRLAGVQITTSEGSPDADVRIRIRGGGSITQDNSPLIIVDGFPVDRISDIPPSDIESIDVLKDASSAAIYGARGANGVIIITTKTGSTGKVRVNYNYYTGVKQLANKLDVMDPYEYTLYQYERAQRSFLDAKSYAEWFGTYEQLGSLYGDLPGIDWQDKVFGRDARSTYHNLSINGGNETTNYNLSLTHNDDNGIMIGSGFKRNNANFRMENKATDKLTINVDLKYSDTEITGAGTSDPGSSTSNNLRHTVQYRPLDIIIEDADFTDEDYYNDSDLSDPISLAEDDVRNNGRKSGTYNGSISYEIVKHLRFKADAGLDTKDERNDRFYGLSTYLARRYGDKPVVTIEQKQNRRFRWSNTLNYTRTDISGLHDINILAGQEYIYSRSKSIENEIRSFPKKTPADIAIGSIGLGEEYQRPQSFESENKLLSYFGRINYGYKDRYLVTATVRADGSSKFAPGNRWGIFPSGSFAWRISEEGFMQNFSTISNLKARISYGQAGNNRIDDFLWTTTYGLDSDKAYFLNDTETSYFEPTYLANPNLVWETTISRNIGLDVGVLNNSYNLTMDIYQNTTKDLLIEQRVPSVSGYETQIQNVGQTTNYGVEFSLDAYIITTPDFSLSANFNIAFNHNKVDNLGGIDYFTEPSDWRSDTGDDYIVKVGEPVGLMYGFVTDGFYTVDDFDYNESTGEYTLKDGVASNEGIVFDGFGPGSYKFKNLSDPIDENGNPVDDGNAVTFDDDRTIIGNSNPKHTGGLNITAQYKGFDLSVFMNWVYGNDIYNADKIEFTSGYKKYTNLLTTMDSNNRWRTINEAGEVVTDPVELAALNENATIWKPQTGRYLFHSWAVEDGSFLRLNNVTFGYTIPTSVLNKIKIEKLRIYFTANNLYTFTNYSGYDPEVDTRRSTPLTPGVDYSAYPRSRSYILGLNLTL